MTKTSEIMKDKGATVMLDRKRTFKFDLNALCILQDTLGNIDQAFNGLQNSDFKTIRTLMYAVLAHEEDDDFTEKDAGALITIQNLGEVTNALTHALSDSMPEDDGEAGNEVGK